MFDSGKEGGYGWCVVISSFLLHAIVSGISYSCGVIHLIFRNYFNNPTHFVTSWISTVMLVTCILAGIPGTVLTYKLGYRLTVIIGGLLAAGGMAASGWCTEYYQVILSFGALAGLGFGLALTPSVMILEHYFFVQRPLAMSVAVAGSSLGLTFLPIATYYLEDMFAWKGMALVYCGLCLNICLCGAAMRPKAETKGRQRRVLLKIFETRLCQSSAFVTLCVVNFLWSLGAIIVYMYLPGYVTHVGQTEEYGVVLIGICGLSSLISRPVFQLFTHSAKLDHTSVFICSIVITAILTGLHPDLFLHKAGQIGYCILFGLHTGFWTTFISYLGTELIGEEFVALGRGFMSICVALGLATGGPLSGWVLDEMDEDYEIIFYLAGACMLLSSCILAVANIKKCYFRPMVDWCDTDSESSSGSTRPLNTCTDEEIVLMAQETKIIEVQDITLPCFARTASLNDTLNKNVMSTCAANVPEMQCAGGFRMSELPHVMKTSPTRSRPVLLRPHLSVPDISFRLSAIDKSPESVI